MLLNNCILHIVNIIYWKIYRPAYAQLGMLRALFPNVTVAALTAQRKQEIY